MRFSTLVLTLVGLLAGTSHSQLTVAAASDLKAPLEEIKRAFLESTGLPVRILYGSSGSMALQAKAGGVDLLLSADRSWADSATSWGLAAEAPQTIATVPVVGWSRRSELTPDAQLAFLKHPLAARIMITDTLLSPDGRAAWNVLAPTADSALRNRISMVGNTEQAIDSLFRQGFVPDSLWHTALGSAILPLSQLWTGPMSGQGRWVAVDTNLIAPMVTSAVVLKVAPARQDNARKFLAFIETPRVRGILRRYGFQIQ